MKDFLSFDREKYINHSEFYIVLNDVEIIKKAHKLT